MMLAGPSLASCALASSTWFSTATSDAESLMPIVVSLNNVSWQSWVKSDTLQIDDTQGEQATCSFTVVNPVSSPVVGDVVHVRYFSQTLFAGTIDRISRRTNNLLTYRTFECTCLDWSQILVRNKILRNFTDMPLQNIVDSLLDNELAGEGLTLGTADRGTTLPLVDSRGGSAFDVLRDAAGITGQTFYVDFDKSIQFRVTSNAAAPLVFDTDHIEEAELKIDRETYRNVQTVRATGTPVAASSEDAVVVTEARQNDTQIAARAAIEGGSGRYEAVDDITHPTSNLTGECQLLAIGYATILLATSGVLRQTLSCRIRNYGFRAGQFATVTLASLGVSGTWLIQRVSIRDENGRRLIHEMELVQSSLQQRAYESWLRIVQGGKITVQMPGSLTSNSLLVTANDTWVVPAGITSVTVTCVGSGGGGGGGTHIWYSWPLPCWAPATATGGAGGAGGKAVSIVPVVEGQTLTLTIGTVGTAGANAVYIGVDEFTDTPQTLSGTTGTTPTTTSITLDGHVVCQADAGTGGTGSTTSNNMFGVQLNTYGVNGLPGSGIGDAVTVGGGNVGGAGGEGAALLEPTDGNGGEITLAW